MAPRGVVDLVFGLNCGYRTVTPWDVLHRHDEVEMTFFPFGGPVVYRFGGKQFEIRSDETLLFWGAVPHQLVDIAPKNVQYWLTVPPETLFRWDLPETMIREVLDGRLLIEKNEELRNLDLLSFPLWKSEAGADKPEPRKTMALSVEARLRRFSNSRLASGNPTGFTPPYLIPKERSAFLAMYDFVTIHFRRDIHVHDIAGAVGLHPNYAISLFRKKCGINLVDLITMLRVYEAQRLILTTEMKIIDVAMEAGFGSMSNFYKSFTRICRKGPKEYRRAARST